MTRHILLPSLFVLVLAAACAGTDSAPDDVPADQGADVSADHVADVPVDPGSDTDDAAEPAPDAVEPAPDTAEPAPDVRPGDVDDDAAPEVLVPVCEGAWAPLTHDTAVDATFLRGPFLQTVEGDGAIVAWRLAPPAEGQPEPPAVQGCVHYAVGGVEADACDDPDANRQYAVHLTGLPPSAEVTYRVSVGDAQTADLRFHSAPADAAPVRLMVFADGHINPDTLPLLSAYGLSDRVDLVVTVGDHINSPEVAQFDQWFSLLRPLLHHVPWWPVLGNHEGRDDLFFNSIEVPGAAPNPGSESYYSARVGNVWFAALELKDFIVSAALTKDVGEVAWLRAQLASPAARTATWRLLMLHEPPWSQGWAPCDYNGEVLVRELVLSLATENGVSAVFSGHTHDYEHGVIDGVNFFITGGGGGSLDLECPVVDGFPQPWTTQLAFHRLVLDAGCDKLVIEARRTDDDAVIDHVEIAPVAIP